MSADGRVLQLIELALHDGWWVPVDAYLRDYADTREAVHTRRAKGIWQDGVHAKYVQGGGLWVNLFAVRKWRAERTGGPTALYRHFAADGSLLYVGISSREQARRREHRLTSPWFAYTARTQVEMLPTRLEALAAERRAIREERPLHNKAGREK